MSYWYAYFYSSYQAPFVEDCRTFLGCCPIPLRDYTVCVRPPLQHKAALYVSLCCKARQASVISPVCVCSSSILVIAWDCLHV
jgi:hypothetical protein